MNAYTISYGGGALLGIPLFAYMTIRAGGFKRIAARALMPSDPSDPSFVFACRVQPEPEESPMMVVVGCLQGLFTCVFFGWLFFGLLLMGICLALGMKG